MASAHVTVDGVSQALLEDGGGDVTAGALEDSAQRVEGAAQAAREGIGCVDGDELAEDGVHASEEKLGLVEPAGPEPIEGVAPQLAGRLGHAVQPRRILHPELGRPWDLDTGDERDRDPGLYVFLGRIVEEAGVHQRRIGAEGVAGGRQRRLGLGQALVGGARVEQVYGADGAGRRPDGGAARGQAGLPSAVGGVQPRYDAVDVVVEGARLDRAQAAFDQAYRIARCSSARRSCTSRYT